jgi:hypothetical protein
VATTAPVAGSTCSRLVEAVESGVRLEEAVLGGLLGVGRRAGDEVGDPESGVLVHSDQLGIGCDVAPARVRDQGRL